MIRISTPAIDAERLRALTRGVRRAGLLLADAIRPTVKRLEAAFRDFGRVADPVFRLEASGAPRCPRRWRKTRKGYRRWVRSKEFRSWAQARGATPPKK